MWAGRSYIKLEDMRLLVQWCFLWKAHQGHALDSAWASGNWWVWIFSLRPWMLWSLFWGQCFPCKIKEAAYSHAQSALSSLNRGSQWLFVLLESATCDGKHLKLSEIIHVWTLLYVKPYGVSLVRSKIRRWMNMLQISSTDIYSQHFLQNNLPKERASKLI